MGKILPLLLVLPAFFLAPVFGQERSGQSGYFEYVENQERIKPGSPVGIDPASGKARVYLPGDEFIGIAGAEDGKSVPGKDGGTCSPVGIAGQVDCDFSQTMIEGRVVYTKDRKRIGILLNNGKVLIK